MLITAAHCLGKVPLSQMVFIPYFHNGTSPFGEWPVTSQTFPKHWFPGGNIGRDFAFLTVSGDVQARERVAGAELLGSGPTHVSRRSGLGTIVGLIGGYQQGGSSPSVSYSSPLGPVAMTLARRLARRRARGL